MSLPKITVFMPVYNGEKYIKLAIDSVLNQSFIDFELLIINDGSTDKSIEIIDHYKDSRIIVYHNLKNEGLRYCRNKGLELAKGKYTAILDCDDIAFKDRLKLQFNFLENNTEYAICGGLGDEINSNGDVISFMNRQVGPVNLHLLFSNQLINSTIMFRNDIFQNIKSYDPEYEVAGDYDLSFRISLNHKAYNLSDKLVQYRRHETNMSSIQNDKLRNEEQEITKNIFSYLNMPATKIAVNCHHSLIIPDFTKFTFNKYVTHFVTLNKYYPKNSFFSKKEYSNHLQNMIFIIYKFKKNKNFSFRLFMISLLKFGNIKFKIS